MNYIICKTFWRQDEVLIHKQWDLEMGRKGGMKEGREEGREGGRQGGREREGARKGETDRAII